MLSEQLINDIAKYIAGRVDSASMILDGEEIAISVLRVDVEGNVVKVFTNASKGNGTVTDIRLKDADGMVLISKPRTVIKNNTFGLVSTFYIRLEEIENPKPVSIFDLGGGVQYGNV